jgi:hypothetical protein
MALVLLSACFFTACGEDGITDNSQNENVRNAMTVTVWGIKGDKTTDAAIEAVEEKMSEITQAKYNTAIDLKLFTVDEYTTEIEKVLEQVAIKQEENAALSEYEAAVNKLYKKSAGSAGEEIVYVEDETYVDEIGITHIVYPEAEELQVDVMYIPDYYKYIEYIGKDYLAALDVDLADAGKEMLTYIHPNILGATKVENSTYAIVNNKPIGEYTYLLVNKALLDKYYYDADEITLFSMADEFIMDVGANEPGIVPVLGEFDPIGIQYFTPDGEKSVVGNMLSATSKKGPDAYGVPRILFTASNYVDHLRQIKKYQSLGYLGDGTADVGEFAVGVVKSSAAEILKYEEEYEIVILQKPHVDNSIYSDMFGISVGTVNSARAMEVLSEINTNSELRNYFAYGIRGEHYELDADGVVMTKNDDPANVYDTPLKYTGNMFIAYPPEGSTPDIWENAKTQNLEIVDDPFFGFFYEDLVDAALLNSVAEISKGYFEELENVPYEEFDEWVKETTEKLKEDPIISMYVSFEDPNGLAAIYNEWFYTLYPNAMA